MTNKPFHELWTGFINDTLTQNDLAVFIQMLQNGDYETQFKESIESLLQQQPLTGTAQENKANIIYQNIMNAAARHDGEESNVVPFKEKVPRYRILKIAAAAAVMGLLILGAWLLTKKDDGKAVVKTKVERTYKNDVLPGGEKAVLTLADGSTIVLDSAHNGALAKQGDTRITKAGAKLEYNAASGSSKEILYNTIATPRGGQYQVELPDGSHVWLNASSSLRFPTAFTGSERRVEVTGEAYFEVAKNAAMPFVVRAGEAEVRVLGTHFNVMAYADEPTLQTTLLEGSVKFVKGNSISLLKPGQQSQLAPGSSIKVVSDVDVDKVMAWKNGLFKFQDADIATVMRSLSRWYDVEVVFQNKNINDQFLLEMPRSSKLSDVLKVLELTGDIHFDIEGKKIIVMK